MRTSAEASLAVASLTRCAKPLGFSFRPDNVGVAYGNNLKAKASGNEIRCDTSVGAGT